MAVRKSTGRGSGGSKILLYGPHGVGKTTFATGLGPHVIVDPNGRTELVTCDDRRRIDTWPDLLEVAKGELRSKSKPFFIVDEFCDIEQLLYQHVARERGWEDINEGDYGAGYRFASRELKNLFSVFADMATNGTHVVVIAHSTIEPFQNPEGKNYDRYVVALREGTHKNPGSREMVMRTFDAVLFCRRPVSVHQERDGWEQKTIGVAADRTVHTETDASYEAKNSFGMRSKEPMDPKVLRNYLKAASMSRDDLVKVVGKAKGFRDDLSDTQLRQLASRAL